MKKKKEPKLVSVTLTDPPKLPLPQADGTVSELNCPFMLHRIPGMERLKFMDEVYRVLSKEGKATFIVPYWSSARAVMDPRTAWPPVCEASFLYFNEPWRQSQNVNGCTCDFDYTFGITPQPDTAARSREVQEDWVKHRINAAMDLHVVMTKRPK